MTSLPSFGGGLMVLVIIVAFLSDRRWVRMACGAYVAFYFAVSIGMVVFGNVPGYTLLLPSIIGVFALVVMSARDSVKNW